MLAFALFGLAYGIVLQRSGFCFARATYELFLLRTREAAAGVMSGLVVTTVGFGAVTLLAARAGVEEHSLLLALPAGAGTIVGGLLFGAGMALSGMCAAGMLQRIGEGYGIAWVVLAGIITGAALNPFEPLRSGALILAGPRLSLAQFAGPGPGFLITLIALALLSIALARARVARREGASPARWRDRLRMFLVPPVVGGILLGILNTAQMAAVVPWTVGYPLALVPASLTGGASEASVRAAFPLLALDGCIVLGACGAAAVSAATHRRDQRARGRSSHGLGHTNRARLQHRGSLQRDSIPLPQWVALSARHPRRRLGWH
jgi:uncharacterized membrane protein YedE/YeeE